MSVDDARGILAGGDTAAADFFGLKTTDRLTASFAPVVARAMEEVGASRQYAAVPAQEERRIRTDPTARTTELLREAFAQR